MQPMGHSSTQSPQAMHASSFSTTTTSRNAVDDLENLLRAGVNANAAANALFGFKHRMSHCVLLSLVYSASTLKINTDKNSNRHPAGSNH